MKITKFLKKCSTFLVSGALAFAMAVPMLVSAEVTSGDGGGGVTNSDSNYYFSTETSSDAAAIKKLFDDNGGYGGYVVQLAELPTDVDIKDLALFISKEDNRFYFNKTAFDAATPTVQKDVIKKLVYATNSKAFKDAHITPKSIQAMVDNMNSRSATAASLYSAELLTYSSTPDIVNALNRVSNVLPVWKIIVGLICIVAFLFITLSTAWDFVFLNASIIQSKLVGDGNKKPFGISQTCYKAFQASESQGKEESGFLNSASWFYLKTRAPELIISVLCFFFLLFGGIFTVIFNLGDIIA